MVTGFLIFRRVGTAVAVFRCPAGEVNSSPELKHRLEKANAFDPAYTHRRSPFREDKFSLSAILQPGQHEALTAFLTAPDARFYLEYTDGSGIDRQYPVEISTLPPCPDNLLEYPDKVEFEMISKYTGTPGYIAFQIIASDDTDENIITNL